MITREALILAGGAGTRLQAVLPGIPKPLAPISGEPFISCLIRYFKKQGIERFIFSLGFEAEKIREYLDNQFPGLEKSYMVEEHPLGTGGAIRRGLEGCREDTVLVLNGDSFFAGKLDGVSAFHHMVHAECTISLVPVQETGRYGTVEMEKDYSIRAFRKKGAGAPGLVNAGVYLLNKRLFMEHDFPASFSFEADYLEPMCGRRRIFGYAQEVYFIDIGVPDDYERAQTEINGWI